MNKRLFLLIVPILLLASCQREMDWSGSPEIKATVEAEQRTRTSLSVDETGAGTIVWNPADKIDVFFGTKKASYTSQNTSDAASAIFKTTAILSDDDVSSTNIWGLYPSNSSSSCNGSSITTVLPSTQYGVPNTFDDDLFMGVAYSTSRSLQFYNVCGGIKFNMVYDDIKKVTFKGNNNENIAGTVSVTFTNGVPKATVTSGVKQITLTPKSGSTFTKGADYYITLLPGTLSNGFTITFTATDGTVGTLNYTDAPVTIKRSVFSRKGNMDVYAAFGDDRQPNNVIYYTSSDGNIITPYKTDVFGANIISNEYVGGRGTITFDSDVTSIGSEAFYNRTRLTSIKMPNTVTSIGDRAFCWCNALSSIVFSGSLTSIGSQSFDWCEGLTVIRIPNSVKSIGDMAFGDCIGLTSIEIPSSVTDLSFAAFSNCTSIASIVVDPDNPVYDSRNNCNAVIETSINSLMIGCENTIIPNSVTTIGFVAFSSASGLRSIVIPSSVTKIVINPFEGCTNLTSIVVESGNPIYDSRNSCNAIIKTNTNEIITGCKNTVIPNTVTSIGESAFTSCGLTSIVIPNSVTRIGKGAFYGCIDLATIEIPNSVTSIGEQAFLYCPGLTAITVLAITPPSLGNAVFNQTNDCPIYVPAGSVDAYKSAWSAYASRIQAIPDSHEAVDLGLPSGLKWSTCNIGASSPEDYGDYFAWGETDTKSSYSSWSDYWWCNGSSTTLTKYNSNSSYGIVDNKTHLELEDDAAHVNWGESWRMPTYSEMIELKTQCTWTWTTQNDINGYKVIGPNGNSIFFPAAGANLEGVGSSGSYWSSSLGRNGPSSAWMMDFSSSIVVWNSPLRINGLSVRPVYGDFIGVSSVALNKSSLTFVVGESETLIPTVMPENATEKQVSWTSSNTSVATVSSEGTVTAQSAGTATITATASDGMKSATFTVTVTQSVTGLSISPGNPTIYTGEQVTLTATVTPSTASNPSVSWTSSDSSVAFVSSDGQVLGLKAGIAVITAQANDGSGVSATCTVTVKQHVTSVSMTAEVQIAWGGAAQLSATVLPADASDKSLTWSSSDESVASVSASGRVTGNVNGTATITATSVDGGYSASCIITVTLPTTRSHLALVLSKNGDAASRYYLTSEQYSNANLSGYYKQGVCVFASTSYYIIANKDLYTSTSGSNANGAATMPNEELATWLISNMPSLNSALTSFGCTAMSTTGNYWTSKKRGDKYYYYFKYNGSLTFDSNASASCRARPVISF